MSTEKVVVVNITNSLTWNTHIHSITAKAYKLLGFLKHTCPLLNDFSAKHILSLYLVNCTILPLPSLVWRLLVDHVLIIICTMGGASHGSSRPVRTFPFDLITLNHFAHIFHFFSWLFNLLYVTCVMVNKAVKKKINHLYCSLLQRKLKQIHSTRKLLQRETIFYWQLFFKSRQ